MVCAYGPITHYQSTHLFFVLWLCFLPADLRSLRKAYRKRVQTNTWHEITKSVHKGTWTADNLGLLSSKHVTVACKIGFTPFLLKNKCEYRSRHPFLADTVPLLSSNVLWSKVPEAPPLKLATVYAPEGGNTSLTSHMFYFLFYHDYCRARRMSWYLQYPSLVRDSRVHSTTSC